MRATMQCADELLFAALSKRNEIRNREMRMVTRIRREIRAYRDALQCDAALATLHRDNVRDLACQVRMLRDESTDADKEVSDLTVLYDEIKGGECRYAGV